MANSELGDINTAPTGGVTTPTETKNDYQTYIYSFTASSAQEDFSFLFRNDPGSTVLDSVSLTDNADPAHTNVVTDGGFESGGQANDPTVPIGWTATVGPGATGAVGALGTNTGSNDTGAVAAAGTSFWVAGATAAMGNFRNRSH